MFEWVSKQRQITINVNKLVRDSSNKKFFGEWKWHYIVFFSKINFLFSLLRNIINTIILHGISKILIWRKIGFLPKSNSHKKVDCSFFLSGGKNDEDLHTSMCKLSVKVYYLDNTPYIIFFVFLFCYYLYFLIRGEERVELFFHFLRRWFMI